MKIGGYMQRLRTRELGSFLESISGKALIDIHEIIAIETSLMDAIAWWIPAPMDSVLITMSSWCCPRVRLHELPFGGSIDVP